MRKKLRAPVIAITAVLALLASGAGTAVADPPTGSQRNYYFSHHPTNSQGYSVVTAYITPSMHCYGADHISGTVKFTFVGRWVAGGNSYVKNVTIANRTSAVYNVVWFRQVDIGGQFELPAPYLRAGQSWSHTINRTITGSYSESAFGSVLDTYSPCGNQGVNDWVVRP